MKELTKKKLIIGGLSVAIVASLSFSIYTSQNLDNDHNDDKKTTEVAKNGDAKKGQKEPEKPVHMNPMDGKEDPALSQGKKDLSLMEIKEAEKEVRDLYRQFKFDSGMDVINRLQESSKFTGEAEVLSKLQFDGSLITNIKENHNAEHEGNGLALINMMNSFKDPETLLLATLSLDSKIRPYAIQFDGSLNPIIGQGETPRIMKQTTVDIPHELEVMYPESKTYHKISFGLEKYLLDAYILEANDGSLRFYMIQDPSGTSNYYTVSQWKKINDNMRKGLPAMDGVLEMKESSYIPSDETVEVEIENPESTVETEPTEESEEEIVEESAK